MSTEYARIAEAESALTIVEENPQGVAALALLRQAAVEARSLYPELFQADSAWPENRPGGAGECYLIAYLAQQAVGCAALRRLEQDIAEVRRVYVVEPLRRRGIARQLLLALEARALQLGYRRLRLETGYRQGAAMALYAGLDYQPIPAFGEYRDDPTSRCFEKVLQPRSG